MNFWTVARTHPNAEKIAIRNLVNQEFNYYQPKIIEKKIRNQKLQQVESPLFPCYLFIQVTDRWNCLKSTHGIASIITMGSIPAIVRDSVIEQLKQREIDGYIQLPKPKQLAVGDKVMINSGSFAGQIALVQRMPVKERQKVLLALLSNQISVLVDENCLEAA